MLYVQLDCNWVHNAKIARAGLDGAGLHAHALCLAKSLETDGWIDLYVLSRFGATDELVDRLVGLGLLERDGDRVRPNDWHDRNPTQESIDKKKASKSESGKRGNHKRWHEGPYDECAECHGETDVQVVAGSDRTRSQVLSQSSPETESWSAIATAIDRPSPDAYRLPDEQAAANRSALEQLRAETGRQKAGAA